MCASQYFKAIPCLYFSIICQPNPEIYRAPQITRLSSVESTSMGGHHLTHGSHAVLPYTIAEWNASFNMRHYSFERIKSKFRIYMKRKFTQYREDKG